MNAHEYYEILNKNEETLRKTEELLEKSKESLKEAEFEVWLIKKENEKKLANTHIFARLGFILSADLLLLIILLLILQ